MKVDGSRDDRCNTTATAVTAVNYYTIVVIIAMHIDLGMAHIIMYKYDCYTVHRDNTR